MNKMKFFSIFAMAIMAGCATLCVLSCSEDEFDDFEDDEVYTLSKPKKTRSGEPSYLKFEVDTDVECFPAGGGSIHGIITHVTGYAYMDRNGTTRWGTVVCDMDDYVIECWLRWTSGTSYMVYVSLNYNGFHAGQTEVDIFE